MLERQLHLVSVLKMYMIQRCSLKLLSAYLNLLSRFMNCLSEVYLYFDLAEFPITARVDSRTTARPGDTVKFAFDVEKIHVFDKETEQVITN